LPLNPVLCGRIAVMTDDEFEAFVEEVVDELKHKQDALTAARGLGKHAAFWFDQPSGTLEFRDEEGTPRLSARVIPVGSHSPRTNTWIWAWSNENILPELRSRAEPLKELSAKTGMTTFSEPRLNVTEEMPWELAAFAVQHLGAVGAYRAPSKTGDLYLAIMDLQEVAAS
jgi:hypothetical protein